MLKAVIFDLDGTLINSFYDWDLIRDKIGVSNLPILTYMNNLKGPFKLKAFKVLESFEFKATTKARLRKGIKEILETISKANLKKAIVTNNTRKNVLYLFKKWKLSFDVIVTRDDGVWKPSAKPLELAVRRMHLKKNEVIFVGDSNPDLLASKKAGIEFISFSQNSGVSDLKSYIEKLC